MRRMCLALVCVGLALGLAWADYAPPAPGPIGWETRIAPGFDPPVEYVVGFGVGSLATGQPGFDPVEAWGPKAVPVLKKMLDDPGWERHRYQILKLLEPFKTAETVESLTETAKAMLSRTPKDKGEAHEVLGVLRTLSSQDAGAADAIVLDASKSVESPYIEPLISYLVSRASSSDGGACLERLKAIAGATEDENIRKRIERSLDSAASVRRAKEPMSVVLEREAGEAKQ